MTSFSYTPISNGATSDVAHVNTPFTALANIVNGGIDSGNLAADSVGASELATGAVADENFAANSPVVVATTVAGLGSARAGKMGMLAVGSSPYEFLPVAYDATYAKWVSAVVGATAMVAAAPITTAGTSYAALTTDQATRLFITNAKGLYDAGMRPQFSLYAAMFNSGANTTLMRPMIFEEADGDTAATELAFTFGEVSHVGVTTTTKISTYTTVTGSPTLTDPHWRIIPAVRVTAGTGSYVDLFVRMRWVSA